MKEPNLLLFGASGHGKVVAEAAELAGWRVCGFADDDPGKKRLPISGWRVIAVGIAEAAAVCRKLGAKALVTIGNNENRKKVHDALLEARVGIATVIHPGAVVSPSCAIGLGTVLLGGVVVNCDSTIGSDVIVNTGATVDHDNVIEDHVHISPGAHLGGTVRVGEGTHVGIGTSIRNNLEVGAWSILGAGSVVVSDVPDRVTVFGNPAKVRKC